MAEVSVYDEADLNSGPSEPHSGGRYFLPESIYGLAGTGYVVGGLLLVADIMWSAVCLNFFSPIPIALSSKYSLARSRAFRMT